MIQDSQANREKCVCKKCPSYPHDCKGEILYCAIGKSRCEIKAQGCICNICPVYYENKLKGLYFCDKEEIEGSKVIMRKKKENEDVDLYKTVAEIKEIAQSGKSIVRSMGSKKKAPFSFADLHFIPAQVHRIPLNREENVNIKVQIGPRAKKPLKISSPIMVSAMSFGAVSKSVKLVIADVASKFKIAFNPGEGGVLEEEIARSSDQIIVQYSTGRFGVNDEILKKAAAVEIRFGQGAYPGKGSYLPAEKITPEIARARGLGDGEASYSPAHHIDIKNKEDLKKKVSYLKDITKGVPVGAKIGCGNIEKDIQILVGAGVDFISLDGFGGGTGATNSYARENMGIPIIAALPRAYKFLRDLGVKNEVSLVAAGGLRTSADFAKCLALGADAVYIGTAVLIAINCQQYRICHTGLCPMGVATQNYGLVKQLDVEEGIEKLSNFFSVSNEEISNFARFVGKKDLNDLDHSDLVSLNRDLSDLIEVSWLDGKINK